MLRLHGQELAVRALERSLAEGRLRHAYLFAGPAHLGKTTLALQLAQALNCTDPAPPCGACGPCARVASGVHADVQQISVDPEATEGPRTVIGIESVRDLIGSAHLRPYEGRTRVFVIHGADRMSQDAANALLKVLEEPPPDVAILLVSDNPSAILPTVRSRCQTLDFSPLPVDEVARILRDEEGAPAEHAEVLARLSRGCVGWAIGAARDDTQFAAVHQRLERIADAAEGGLEARFGYADDLARRFQRDRAAGREELQLWLRWVRDLLLVQHGQTDRIVNLSWRETLERQAAALTPAQVVRWAHEIMQTIERLERNANPRLALEALMLETPRAKLTSAAGER